MATASVAVTGLGAVTPLGPDVASLWQGLLAGRSGVRRIDGLLAAVPGLPVRIAAPMAEEPLASLPRVQARRMDRCQLAALAAARLAWADAGSPGAEALAFGARLIRAGEADVVIAGGAEAAVAPLTVAAFAQAMALSKRNDEPERASRPFDADRDGFVLGEGPGVMILEREDFATGRGAAILGHLAGYGITADAHHITAPTRPAPARSGRC